jgi:hypothetical protein
MDKTADEPRLFRRCKRDGKTCKVTEQKRSVRASTGKYKHVSQHDEQEGLI